MACNHHFDTNYSVKYAPSIFVKNFLNLSKILLFKVLQ
ncbi:MAG: hypothetical protein JWQ40_613 [Segetibacter sp.]|nr:hypothetical protein [Segetibacter sp.]